MSDLDEIFNGDDIEEEVLKDEEQAATLWEAIDWGDTKKVEEYAKDATQLNSLCEGETPLVAAVKSGNYDIVKILLDNGANPYFTAYENADEDYSNFPFTIAENEILRIGTEYDARIVTLLKEACKKYPKEFASEICWNLTVNDNGTLHYEGDLVEYVLNNVIGSKKTVNMRDKKGNTPLISILSHHGLLRNGYDRIVALLLDSGADPNARNNVGMTPLTQALFMHLNYFGHNLIGDYGYTGVVKMLLDHGVDFGYALYSNVEVGKNILDRLEKNEPHDNLQGIIHLLFGKFEAENKEER